MKKRNFLNLAGVTAVDHLVARSREVAADLIKAGLKPAGESPVNLVQGPDGPELNIYGQITPFAFFDEETSANDVIAQLREVKGQDITVRINSPGGSVFEGVAIFNLLKQHKGQVTTVVDGFAGSIASVIFMAGDRRLMGEASRLMIHNASTTVFGAYSDDLREVADLLDSISTQIRDVYARRVNMTAEEITAAMDKETYYTEAEALEAGFADEIIEDAAPQDPPEEPPAPPENVGTVEDVLAIRERNAELAARFGLPL